MTEKDAIDQKELTSIVCDRHLVSWRRSVPLRGPSAADILWDLKRHYYCGEENQEITRQDIQNDALRNRIQTLMESRGFPAEWAEGEYEIYFEKLFGKAPGWSRRRRCTATPLLGKRFLALLSE